MKSLIIFLYTLLIAFSATSLADINTKNDSWIMLSNQRDAENSESLSVNQTELEQPFTINKHERVYIPSSLKDARASQYAMMVSRSFEI